MIKLSVKNDGSFQIGMSFTILKNDIGAFVYFSRLTLSKSSRSKKFLNFLFNNFYKEHQVLWKLFNSDSTAQRDFLCRKEFGGDDIKYYVVSSREPRDNDNIWEIETKKYAPKITKGQILTFALRANPVITVSTSDGKRKRHDIVMHRKIKMDYKNLSPAERPPFT